MSEEFLISENNELRKMLLLEKNKVTVLERALAEVKEKLFEMAEIIEQAREDQENMHTL